MTEEQKKVCPFCGQEISLSAKKCIHCGKWLDKTIKCPTCGETINESAKICRFCKEPVPHRMSLPKFNFKFGKEKTLIASGIAGAVVVGFIIFNLVYVPPCSSGSVLNKVTKQLNKSMFENVTIDYEQPLEKRTFDNGRVCKVKGSVYPKGNSDQGAISYIEYKFIKNGFGLSLDSHFALPDCYEQRVQETIKSIIEDKYEEFNMGDKIKEVTVGLIEPNGTKNDGTPSEEVYCKAEGVIKFKPGWGNDEDTKVNINATVKHCEGPYKWCVESEWRRR